MDNDEVLQLLDRIGREDQAAFRQLYKAFSRRVYAYAANMLNDFPPTSSATLPVSDPRVNVSGSNCRATSVRPCRYNKYPGGEYMTREWVSNRRTGAPSRLPTYAALFDGWPLRATKRK